MSPVRLVGSSSGFVTLDAPAVAGSNTLVLPTGNGSSGQVLSTNGSGALSWIGAGKILQVVNATYSTSTTNSTDTLADTGLTATITPSSSSNKILVLVSQNGVYKSAGNATNGVQIRLFRGTTELALNYAIGYAGTALQLYPGSCSFCYLDSPATTSATTYKTRFANIIAASLVAVQADGSNSHITLLEVAA